MPFPADTRPFLPENALPAPDAARLARTHLVLFLEYASTLAIYDKVGLLDRELELYRRLRGHLRGISIVTWSRGEDEIYRGRLGDIELVHNRLDWSWPVWMGYLYFFFGWRFRAPCIVKTNQMSGAQHVLRIARRARTPLVARCGYPWSRFARREKGPDHPETRQAEATERAVFGGAAHVVGSTAEIRAMAIEDYGIAAGRVSVVPNYVDTDLFSPRPRRAGPPTALFLGRLEDQKNPLALVEALAGTGLRLLIVGDGSLRGAIEADARRHGVDVEFRGNVPHRMLPETFAEADLFVLPSRFEGHPKALMEAMAFGLPVVASDVVGISEVVRDGDTGLLCPPTAAGLAAAIGRLRADPALAARLGKAARAAIVADVSLDRTIDRELRVLDAAIRQGEVR
jgi:glycosyltransferase involved in cell wall biosynthesis